VIVGSGILDSQNPKNCKQNGILIEKDDSQFLID
jgi:hypothetical protein